MGSTATKPLSGKRLKQYKHRLSLTSFQRELVIGCVVGDAHLRITNENKEANLIIDHSLAQREYVDWKYQQLQKFVLTPPKKVERLYHKDPSRKTYSYRFLTISHADFTDIYKAFYPEGKKKIPDNILGLLDSPVALACWVMDDGNKNRDALYINTQQFSAREQELLCSCLNINFGIRAKLNKHSVWDNKQYYRIRIDRVGARILYQLIQPYVLSSMEYKFVADTP